MDRREMSRQYAKAGYSPVQYSNSGFNDSSSKKQLAPQSSASPYNAPGVSRTIMDRLHDRHSRFAGINLSERDIEEILADAASTLDLDLSGASLVEDIPYFIADSISRNSYYEFVHVNLNSTSISQKGYEIMMELIAQCRDLETLSLRNNALQQDAGMAIAKTIGARGKLRILDVSDNFIGDAGVAVLAGALTADLSSTKHIRSSLLSLQVLELSSNHIGDNGLLALCRGLIHFAKHLAAIDKKSALKVLRLDKNNLGEKSALCLSQLFQTCREIGSICIEELSLNDNPIGPPGISALFHAVSRQPKSGTEVESAAYAFENEIQDIKQGSGEYSDGAGPDARLTGGTLLVLSLARCRPDLSVLEELSSLLRHGSLLKALDLSMTRHAARDVSQQPGFVETVVTLVEGVAHNASIKALSLGDLTEVCHTAAVIAAPNSYQLAAIKRAIDGLNSINAILKLDTAQQRINWYSKHYFGGGDTAEGEVNHMDGLSPLPTEERRGSHDSEDRGQDRAGQDNGRSDNRGGAGDRSARKGDAFVGGAPEAVSIHRAEFEKIRRDHVDAFSELSSQIQELQHGKLREVEDLKGEVEEGRQRRRAESPRARSPIVDSPSGHEDDRSEGSQHSNRRQPGLHYSHPKVLGGHSLRPQESGGHSSRRATPERRRADGTRLYDEASVQALIKAAVNSALKFGQSVAAGHSPEHTMPTSTLQSTSSELNGTNNTAMAQKLNELLDSRLAIVEDRLEGIEVQQQEQINDTVPRDLFLDLQSLTAKLEGRLKVVEEYMVRSDSEKRQEDEKNQRDQTALKEYIIKLEENQRQLISRLEDLEVTLEADSETSIGLLDMLLKKIGSSGHSAGGVDSPQGVRDQNYGSTAKNENANRGGGSSSPVLQQRKGSHFSRREEEILSEKNEKHDALRRLVFSHANRGGSIDGRVGAHHHDNRPTIDAITDTHFPNTESKSDGKSSDNRVPRSDEGNVEM